MSEKEKLIGTFKTKDGENMSIVELSEPIKFGRCCGCGEMAPINEECCPNAFMEFEGDLIKPVFDEDPALIEMAKEAEHESERDFFEVMKEIDEEEE